MNQQSKFTMPIKKQSINKWMNNSEMQQYTPIKYTTTVEEICDELENVSKEINPLMLQTWKINPQ